MKNPKVTEGGTRAKTRDKNMTETQELASKQPPGNHPQLPSSMASTFTQESVHICKKVEKI